MNISIVTAAYNGSRFLPAMLDSVLAQTATDWELVFVDDGSVDDTVKVASAYASRDNRIRVLTKPNGGAAAARNFGYRHTTADTRYVTFLDQDDVWEPQALGRLVAAMEADPQFVAAHGLTRQIDPDGKPHGSPEGTVISWERRKISGRGIKVCSRTEPTTFATLICNCCIPTPGAGLIRRDAFERLRTAKGGYFDEAVGTGDDWDMWLRLSLLGDIRFVDEVLLNWRIHNDNGTHAETFTFASESRVRLKIAGLADLPLELAVLAEWRRMRVSASNERHNARSCWEWAWQRLREGRWDLAVRHLSMWRERYLHYVSLRLRGSTRHRLEPIPALLESWEQVEAGFAATSSGTHAVKS